MKTNKVLKIALMLVTLVAAEMAMAQNQLSITAHDIITLDKMGEGKASMPYLSDDQMKFSNSGNFLYIVAGEPRSGTASFIIYNVFAKQVEKTFDIPMIKDFYGDLRFAINPSNEFEIIIQTSKKEIIYLPNWSNESSNVMTERKKALRTDRVFIEVPEYPQFTYSGDGEKIYVRKGMSVITLDKKGNAVGEKKFTKQDGTGFIFVGKDLVGLFSEQKSSIKGFTDHVTSFFSLTENKVVSSFNSTGDTEFGSTDFLNSGMLSFDTRQGKEIEAVKKTYDNFSPKSSKRVYPIPNTNGLFAIENEVGFFTTQESNGANIIETPLGYKLNNMKQFCFQVSPNGKYFIVGFEGINHLVIFKLY